MKIEFYSHKNILRKASVTVTPKVPPVTLFAFTTGTHTAAGAAVLGVVVIAGTGSSPNAERIGQLGLCRQQVLHGGGELVVGHALPARVLVHVAALRVGEPLVACVATHPAEEVVVARAALLHCLWISRW